MLIGAREMHRHIYVLSVDDRKKVVQGATLIISITMDVNGSLFTAKL
jgi:hypothetical protein